MQSVPLPLISVYRFACKWQAWRTFNCSRKGDPRMKKLFTASSVLFLAMGVAIAQQSTAPPTGTQANPHQTGIGDSQAQIPNREPNGMTTQGATTTQPTSDQNQNAPGTENNAVQNTNQTPTTTTSPSTTTTTPSDTGTTAPSSAGTMNNQNSNPNTTTTTPDQTASPATGSTVTSTPSTNEQNTATPQDTGTSRLPQTASPLPLMGLLGLGSVAGGFWTSRKRRK